MQFSDRHHADGGVSVCGQGLLHGVGDAVVHLESAGVGSSRCQDAVVDNFDPFEAVLREELGERRRVENRSGLFVEHNHATEQRGAHARWVGPKAEATDVVGAKPSLDLDEPEAGVGGLLGDPRATVGDNLAVVPLSHWPKVDD